MKNMIVIIPAAGKGTRIESNKLGIPKCLIEVEGKTLIDHSLETVKKMNIKDVIIVVGFMKEKIIEHLKDKYPELNIKFIEQKEQLGVAHAIMLCEEYIKDHFIVLFPDYLFKGDLSDTIKKHFEKNAVTTWLLEPGEPLPNCLGVNINGEGIMTDLTFNTSENYKKLNYRCLGLAIHNKEIIERLKKQKLSERGEYESIPAQIEQFNEGKILLGIVADYPAPHFSTQKDIEEYKK